MSLADTSRKRLLWAVLLSSVLLAIVDRGAQLAKRPARAGVGAPGAATSAGTAPSTASTGGAGEPAQVAGVVAGHVAEPSYARLNPEKEARLALGLARDPFSARTVFRTTSGAPRRLPAGTRLPIPSLPPVTAVSVGGGSALAFMEGRIVTVGDTVRGFVVLEIGNGGVTLSRGDVVTRVMVGGG